MKKIKHRRIIVKRNNNLYPYTKMNKRYKYILEVINVISKFVWFVPMKSKTGKQITKQ